MDPQWLGPYLVAKDLGKGFYSLEDLAKGKKVTERINGAHLKIYVCASSLQVQYITYSDSHAEFHTRQSTPSTIPSIIFCPIPSAIFCPIPSTIPSTIFRPIPSIIFRPIPSTISYTIHSTIPSNGIIASFFVRDATLQCIFS